MGFGSISPNMLMSFQYGLNIIPSERDQFYYRELTAHQDQVSYSNVTAVFERVYSTIAGALGFTANLSGLSAFASLGSVFGQT